MPLVVRLLARVTPLVLVAGGLVLLGGPPTAYAVTSHRALNDTRAVTEGPVRVGFPVEWFGVVADLSSRSAHLSVRGAAPYGQVRFQVDGRWTGWQALEQDGAQAAGQFTSALVPAGRAQRYQVRGLPTAAHRWRAAAINTTDGPSVVVGHRRAGAAVAAPACRSRADWGADESLTDWSKGTATQAYYPAQVLTVHHTAGSNDPAQDYAATMRAIYSYHVQSNGWADIGYQYLVDGRGVVYEGRDAGHTSRSCLYDGGDGSDFAHRTGSDDVVTGAHVGGWNSGNVGVALMGCYESTSACSGSTTPPAAAVDGLEGLLASLAARHHLDPQARTQYVNPVNGTSKDVATISGHRDWEATACPGGTLYAQLPTIRADVAARLGGGTPTPPPPATITSGACTNATCTFTGAGTGTLSWSFGNGRTATGSKVSTTYSSAGTWTVTLTDAQSPPTSATRAVTCRTNKRKVVCST